MNIKTLNRPLALNGAADAVIAVVFFVIATALGAYVRFPIPGTPVPVTLQTFFVLLSGAVLGRRLGPLSQAGYVMLGVLGVPIFQAFSSGVSYILGPTGGYLIGFVLAAVFVGRATKGSDLGLGRLFTVFILGDAILLASGTVWLVSLYRIDLLRAVSIGALPFIPGDMLKALAAAFIYSRIERRVKSILPVCQR